MKAESLGFDYKVLVITDKLFADLHVSEEPWTNRYDFQNDLKLFFIYEMEEWVTL